MRRLRDDSGLSLAELIVVVALMGVVLSVVYLGIRFAYRAQDIADTQAQFAKDISTPMRVLDQSFSQSTTPPFGTVAEPYHVRVRMPAEYVPGQTIEHDYSATSDGRLVQTVYKTVGTTTSVVRQVTWSRNNANRSLGVPLFTYYEGSAASTSAVAADSVMIQICARYKGATYRDQMRVAFRNR